MKPMNLHEMWSLFHLMRGNVKYGLGAKAVPLSKPLDDIKKIDCSGFVRLAFFRCADQVIPDGSWHQKAWAAKHFKKLKRYSDVQYAKDDKSRLFLCFIPPGIPTLGGVGHVWFVCGGKTLESRGGKGVDSRPWHQATLLKFAASAYEIPTE